MTKGDAGVYNKHTTIMQHCSASVYVCINKCTVVMRTTVRGTVLQITINRTQHN